MFKNINIKTFILISAAVIFTALPGYCAPTVPLKQAAIKFLFAMGGVALSSFLIFLGLSVYNRLFKNANNNENDDDSLSTPDNINDAIIFFIKKNKLK